ncbi:beta-ketoacyl synthase N-terminal-like domain-containing protein [Conchiformibius steedae]|uniref:Beta-ketoacyl synthase C-terminal domain-containing protein n=1 Tax=Conchiformibius steedae TaxID=153493 RepID=A0A3P2AB30_9NEIS|nr:beta-ketoacyl synthase N-terminal-like domain-containing protein [Conchiformibius steedae]RRD90823.1 hypothetical protein EII21_04245 [Conchiformibius steedae]
MNRKSVYLRGGSLQCAQGSIRIGGSLPAWQPWANRVLRRITPLGQTRDLPYFAAFPNELCSKNAQFVLLEQHIRAAVADAGLPDNSLSQLPVFIGSGTYVLADWEQNGGSSYRLDETAAALRRRFRNPDICALATSCTASAHALIQAVRHVALHGGCAVAAGIETFNRTTLAHFDAMNLLARHPNDRHAMTLGEAVAAVVVCARQGVVRLHSCTAQTDYHALTLPDTDALSQLIHSLLNHVPRLAGVKLHGTGGASDQTERQLWQRLHPSCTLLRLKPYLGHTLGAAGVAETVLLAACLRHRRLPDQIALPAGAYANVFLGFGGSHAAWILESPHAD